MSDNPFLDADEDENSTPEGADGNQNFKQLRSYARKQEQLAKQLQAENLALKTRVTESAFKEAGLSEKHASLFAKVHEGDVTPEAVIQFATEYELPRREAPAVIAEDGAATPAPATDDGAILDLSTGEVTKPPGFAPAQQAGRHQPARSSPTRRRPRASTSRTRLSTSVSTSKGASNYRSFLVPNEPRGFLTLKGN
jgi:hypothetical protein